MAEFESEDSSNGALVIDERTYYNEEIVISDDSDSEGLKIVEVDDDSSPLCSSSSTIVNLKCNCCSKLFTNHDDFLNHTKKFEGNCMNISNEKFMTKRQIAEDLSSKPLVKRKRGRPPKTLRKIVPKTTVPKAVPLRPPPLLPLPTMRKDKSPDYQEIPSLRQLLVDEIEPEYPCETCGQVFRHNIGLICHYETEHSIACDETVTSETKKSTTRRNYYREKKLLDHIEPASDVINLTLLPDFKKDSRMNRMKSYVQSTNKGQVYCVLCNTHFDKAKKALAHIEAKHMIGKIQCGYCNMKFVYELKLRSHLAKRHKVIAVYKCDKCLKMINKEECETHSQKCKEIVSSVSIKEEDEEEENVVVV